MNYLAHARLSFYHPEILVGNLISDFVKGKKKMDYPEGIRNGISLHRAIDEFTDQHPAVREAKQIFRPAYRLYCGAFVDVVLDHFLACDNNEFTEKSLLDFSHWVYETAGSYEHAFPERFRLMFPYMRSQNWLYHYRTRWGTGKSFGGLVRRAAYIDESETAFRLFEEHYGILQYCYNDFYPFVKAYSLEVLDGLIGKT